MDHANVTSGAAFKTAVRATGILLVILTLASVTAYFYLQRQMLGALEDQIGEDRMALNQIYLQGGQIGLINVIDDLRQPLGVKQRAVGLFTARGAKLAGNLDRAPEPEGWSKAVVNISAFTAAEDESETASFYMHKGQVGGFTLVIGRSLTDVELQQHRMIAAFAGLGAVMSAAFLILGFGASLQTQRKLDHMTRTLDRVSQGDVNARLPVAPGQDQIDRVSAAMNLHLDRLSMLMQTTRASAAAIAHDLRTPLSRAFLLIDRAQTTLDEGQDARDLIDGIEAELVRLNAIFDAIMRISRLETAQAEVTFVAVPLAPLLTDLAETFAPVAEERDQSLTLAPVPANLTLRGDAAMLAQLIANLIQNAINHCPAGTAITFGAKAEAGQVRLWISDTGAGIPEAEYDKVFELFYRIDPNRTGGGNGLGMALVKAIAERLGGHIVLSDAKPGLRVDVTFPQTESTEFTA
jgi:signal transduction histidine kinase